MIQRFMQPDQPIWFVRLLICRKVCLSFFYPIHVVNSAIGSLFAHTRIDLSCADGSMSELLLDHSEIPLHFI